MELANGGPWLIREVPLEYPDATYEAVRERAVFLDDMEHPGGYDLDLAFVKR